MIEDVNEDDAPAMPPDSASLHPGYVAPDSAPAMPPDSASLHPGYVAPDSVPPSTPLHPARGGRYQRAADGTLTPLPE